MSGMSGIATPIEASGAFLLFLWAVGMWAAVGALHIANRRRRAWVYGTTVALCVVSSMRRNSIPAISANSSMCSAVSERL